MTRHRRVGCLIGWDVGRGHRLGVNAALHVPALDGVVTCGRDGTVRLWRGSEHVTVCADSHADSVNCVAPLAPLSDAFVTGGADHCVVLHAGFGSGACSASPDGDGCRRERVAMHTDSVRRVAAVDAGTAVLSASLDGTVLVYDPRHGMRPRQPLAVGAPLYAMAVVPGCGSDGCCPTPSGAGGGSGGGGSSGSGSSLFGGGGGGVGGGGVGSGGAGGGLHAGSAAVGVGPTIVVGCGRGNVYVLDTRLPSSDGVAHAIRHAHSGCVRDACVLSSGLVATASADGTVKIWDFRAPRYTLHVAAHSDAVFALCSFANSHTVLSGGRDGGIVATNTAALTSSLLASFEAPVTHLSLAHGHTSLLVCTTLSTVEAYPVAGLVSTDAVRAGVADDPHSTSPGRISFEEADLPPALPLRHEEARRYAAVTVAAPPPAIPAESTDDDGSVASPGASAAAAAGAAMAASGSCLPRVASAATAITDAAAVTDFGAGASSSAAAELLNASLPSPHQVALQQQQQQLLGLLTPAEEAKLWSSSLSPALRSRVRRCPRPPSVVMAGVPAALHAVLLPGKRHAAALYDDGTAALWDLLWQRRVRAWSYVGSPSRLERVAAELAFDAHAATWCHLACRWGALCVTLAAEEALAAAVPPWELTRLPVRAAGGHSFGASGLGQAGASASTTAPGTPFAAGRAGGRAGFATPLVLSALNTTDGGYALECASQRGSASASAVTSALTSANASSAPSPLRGNSNTNGNGTSGSNGATILPATSPPSTAVTLPGTPAGATAVKEIPSVCLLTRRQRARLRQAVPVNFGQVVLRRMFGLSPPSGQAMPESPLIGPGASNFGDVPSHRRSVSGATPSCAASGTAPRRTFGSGRFERSGTEDSPGADPSLAAGDQPGAVGPGLMDAAGHSSSSLMPRPPSAASNGSLGGSASAGSPAAAQPPIVVWASPAHYTQTDKGAVHRYALGDVSTPGDPRVPTWVHEYLRVAEPLAATTGGAMSNVSSSGTNAHVSIEMSAFGSTADGNGGTLPAMPKPILSLRREDALLCVAGEVVRQLGLRLPSMRDANAALRAAGLRTLAGDGDGVAGGTGADRRVSGPGVSGEGGVLPVSSSSTAAGASSETVPLTADEFLELVTYDGLRVVDAMMAAGSAHILFRGRGKATLQLRYRVRLGLAALV